GVCIFGFVPGIQGRDLCVQTVRDSFHNLSLLWPGFGPNRSNPAEGKKGQVLSFSCHKGLEKKRVRTPRLKRRLPGYVPRPNCSLKGRFFLIQLLHFAMLNFPLISKPAGCIGLPRKDRTFSPRSHGALFFCGHALTIPSI